MYKYYLPVNRRPDSDKGATLLADVCVVSADRVHVLSPRDESDGDDHHYRVHGSSAADDDPGHLHRGV